VIDLIRVPVPVEVLRGIRPAIISALLHGRLRQPLLEEGGVSLDRSCCGGFPLLQGQVELLSSSLEGLHEESLLRSISWHLDIAVYVGVVELHTLPILLLVFCLLLQRAVELSHVLLHISLVEAWRPYVGVMSLLLDFGLRLVLLGAERVSSLAKHVKVAENILLILLQGLRFEEFCGHFLDVLHCLSIIVLA